MKFLGSAIEESNTPIAMFAQILSKLETKLANKSTLRGELQLNIYSRYALPSVQYFLLVQPMDSTHMKKTMYHIKKTFKIMVRHTEAWRK